MPKVPHDDAWTELASLVDRLLDVPTAERPAVIEELSAGVPERRRALEALATECEREPAILRRGAAEQFTALFDDAPRFPESLISRYGPVRELGRGGMAIVYLARDTKHGRDVAVKVVGRSITATLVANRFLREIEIVAQLRHPHIVPLFDSGAADGALYYVMPYEPGLSLRHRLARDGRMDRDEVVFILRDVCDALAYAHARGVVHRDIKPDNVLLAGRHALVTDFGVAKTVLAITSGVTSKLAGDDPSPGEAAAGPVPARRPMPLTTLGVALGTPTYMAPEQIAGDRDVDHRADIYAVGVLGYELLAGQPPFVRHGRNALLAAQMADVPEPLTTHRPDCPADLADLIMKCLAKDPDARWQSADEMVRRLDGIAAGRQTPPPAAAARWRDRWARLRIERVTDFAGSQVDAAISADGRWVAFLSDRDGSFDAFVTEVGSGRFTNLTDNRFPELYNEDVRNVGFTPDASHVWIRMAGLSSAASISLVPTTGGALRPFLESAVTVAWSHDGTRLAYHELTPGDPIFLADGDGGNPRRLYVGEAGVHSHHPAWSRDGRFLYVSHGVPPDNMDIWRIPTDGGRSERITSHQSRVGYPVVLDDRTVLYTASGDDGGGLYMVDVDERAPIRLSAGVEHYTSIAASAELPGRPRRLAAMVSNPRVQLWGVPIAADAFGESSGERLSLPTARSAAPRFARDGSLFYLASRGGIDALWRMAPDGAREVWRPMDGVIVGAAAISPDNGTVSFVVRRNSRSSLALLNTDSGRLVMLAESLDVRGAPSWSPDGNRIAITAVDAGGTRVFTVPVDGGSPMRIVDSASSNPVWSPNGSCILYSGMPRGRSVTLSAVTPGGSPVALPFSAPVVDRLGDSYRFVPDGSALIVKLGGFRQQNLWRFDMVRGAARQITDLRAGESIHRFDVAPDGSRVVFERVQENSDIALLELPSA
ncbi:MAG TPA: protein kinase [Gemmatimonadaceae bacterium]|nr:protein kinase [Gemmatimonadaceae bacterium]